MVAKAACAASPARLRGGLPSPPTRPDSPAQAGARRTAPPRRACTRPPPDHDAALDFSRQATPAYESAILRVKHLYSPRMPDVGALTY